MKWIYFLILSILTLARPCFVRAEVWIRDDRSDKSDFQSFVFESPQRQTLIQFSEERWQQDLRPLPYALPVANLNNQPSLKLVKNLQELEKQTPWSQEGLLYLRDYAEQSLQSGQLSLKLQESYKILFCHYQVLLQEDIDPDLCKFENYMLQDFKKLNPEIEVLYMNQLPVELNRQTQIKVLPNQEYHWKMLSNKANIQTLKGTAQDVLTRKIDFQNLVRGDCGEFEADKEGLPESAQIFFSKNCQKSLSDAGLRTPWYRKNRTFLIGLGLLASAWYLHDKTVVFTLP